MSKVSEEQPGERTRQRSRRWGMYREIDALIDDNRELAIMTPAEIRRYSGMR
jgi:hypothetical protein